MTQPVFGKQEEGVDYINRYGVYAVIPDETKTKIILVQAPNGAWFLPGGEIEKDESHHEALTRELLEELGYRANFGQYYGQADEYFYSSHRDTHYYNPAYIYEVTSFTKIGNPIENFNNLSWFPIEEAREKLKRDSHKWGIDQWSDHHLNQDKKENLK